VSLSCNKVADSGGVVIQKRRCTIFDTYIWRLSTPVDWDNIEFDIIAPIAPLNSQSSREDDDAQEDVRTYPDLVDSRFPPGPAACTIIDNQHSIVLEQQSIWIDEPGRLRRRGDAEW